MDAHRVVLLRSTTTEAVFRGLVAVVVHHLHLLELMVVSCILLVSVRRVHSPIELWLHVRVRDRVPELTDCNSVSLLVHTSFTRVWHVLDLLVVHDRRNTWGQLGKRWSRLTCLLDLFLFMILLWGLATNLKYVCELRSSLGLRAFKTFARLNQELSLFNFVTRLESLAWDRNPDIIGFLDRVDNCLAISTEDASSIVRIIVEAGDAEGSGSLLQWGWHHMAVLLVFLSLRGKIWHLTLLLVSDRSPHLDWVCGHQVALFERLV